MGQQPDEPADVGAALAGVPDGAPRVVLMHDPTVICGIGFGVAPIRIDAPPRVAYFDLRPGPRRRHETVTRIRSTARRR